MRAQVLLFSDISPNLWGWGRGGGAYKVATELRKAGFTVRVIEAFSAWSPEELEEIIDRSCDPDTLYVGFSTTLMERPTFSRWQEYWTEDHYRRKRPSRVEIFSQPDEVMLRLRRRIRGCSNALLIGGGSWAQHVHEHPAIDGWVVGEGDVSAVALAKALSRGTAPKGWPVLRAVDYPYRTFSDDGIVWNKTDHLIPGEALSLEVARGCIFACAFCRFDMLGKAPTDYVRTPESLYLELMRNYEEFGTTVYFLCDDTLNDTVEKVRMLHQVSTRLPFRLEYSAYLRLDLIWRYREQRDLLLESGLRSAVFGIETLDDKAGRVIGKGLGQGRIFESLDYLRGTWKDQAMIYGNFIVGLPGETRESLEQTYEWVSREDCPLDAFHFMPLSILMMADEEKTQSKFDRNPGQYGYRARRVLKAGVDGTRTMLWENDIMTLTEARKIAIRFNCGPGSRRIRPAAAMASRFLGLGFTFAELWQSRDDTEFVKEAWDRRAARIQEYKQAVLR